MFDADGHGEKLTVAFRNFANAPENSTPMFQRLTNKFQSSPGMITRTDIVNTDRAGESKGEQSVQSKVQPVGLFFQRYQLIHFVQVTFYQSRITSNGLSTKPQNNSSLHCILAWRPVDLHTVKSGFISNDHWPLSYVSD